MSAIGPSQRSQMGVSGGGAARRCIKCSLRVCVKQSTPYVSQSRYVHVAGGRNKFDFCRQSSCGKFFHLRFVLGEFFFRVQCRLAFLVKVEERSWFNRCSSERGGWSGRNDDDHGARKNENRKETMGICLPCYTCRKAYKQVGAFWAGNAMPGGYNRNLIIDKSVRKMDWIFKLRNSPKQSEI